MVKVFIYFILLGGFSSNWLVQASSTFFDFSHSNNLIYVNHPFTINVKYILKNSPESRFLIRPVADNSLPRIYNPALGEWVYSTDNWDKMPTLSSDVRLKYDQGVLLPKSINLRFEILDTKTAKVYTTLIRSIWTYGVYDNYISIINDNIRLSSNVLLEY